ncbi:uncharacterized protein LOC123663383 [Melitaea cinxia]|uniref:uncharacterized protein LOC123663383 n=1 Tax=Melitaea cinxia TaxID=113334 RepID=UPI001E26F614|nr:uncharacterized protein LOC123663383 [Melitaea cinxia]
MLRSGRVRYIVSSIITRIVYLFAIIKVVNTIEYGVPIEIKLWDSKRSPLSHMVDVTNEFGLKILAEHNFLNDNNIAFSPYGLMGILVALYEGVDGESSYQIQRSMQLPWNRNVMRIGFRDIHRTLKTYFVPEEGFLAGLALNNENVTFNESYKKILRFYGFDLDKESSIPPSVNNTSNNNNQSNTMSPNNTSLNDVTTATETTTESVTGREDPLSSKVTESAKEETTLNPNAETINTVDIREREPTTTLTPVTENTSSSISSIKISPANDDVTQTTEQSSTPVSSMITESVAVTDTTSTILSTQPTTNEPTETSGSTTNSESDSTITQMMTSNVDVTTNNIDPSTANLNTITSTQVTESDVSSTTTTEIQQTETTLSTETSTLVSTMPTTSTLETLARKKKSIVDFLFTNPPDVDDFLVYRSFDVGLELSEESKENEKMFLVNGLRNMQVTYMHYDSVLEYAYLPHLEASALRLPLDSERYYLLVVLPNRRGSGELARLLGRMARESDLSDVYAALRPRRVRAVVPSFIVKGHITLTTDLQKLGIHDVFEPRQHDFTPMTPQPGVYVRSIEQAVSVAIRKYQPDVKNRYISNRNQVVFSASHPFLYFVMDSNIHVALMAGKLMDPLNTRIL